MAAFDPRSVGRLPGTKLAAVAYRNQAPGFDPRSGDGARRFGGRFNGPHSFPVLYLCTSNSCVVAELTRQARRQNIDVADLLPRELWRLKVNLTRVLDLTDDDALHVIGTERAELVRDDQRLTRPIGEAAFEHRFQAIRSSSATGVDEILAIFPANLAGALIETELVSEWRTIEDLP